MNQGKIGKFIAECRKRKGLLQRDIAVKLGITVNEVLAGESISIMDLMRSIDMSRLELVKQLEFEQLRMRLYKLYGIEICHHDYCCGLKNIWMN